MKNGIKWLCVGALVALVAACTTVEETVEVTTVASDVIQSESLSVMIDQSFPRVVSYTDLASGAVFFGQSETITNVLLNGTAYVPTVQNVEKTGTSVRYALVFPEAGNVEMVATLSVEGSVLTFSISGIKDNDGFRINSVEIPGNSLISVSSDQSGAALAAATIQADKSKQMDTFTQITAEVSATNTAAAYAILNTDQLAATMVNNSAYDIDKNDVLPKGVKKDKSVTLGNARVRVAVETTTEGATASLSSGEWTYRAAKSDLTEETLWCKVIITGDRNDDGQIDWQDGAVAYRDIMEDPFKSELTRKRVAQHIVFNFGSAAGEPFLRTLDNVKRVHYATDGLGQFILLKGYQSEGHDSAHPDYGGNIGRRQGGKEEMNILVDTAQEWNAEVGVHINCQEAYPEAYTFESDMVYTNKGGWNWIDQSYIMNHRWDITSGAFEKRVQHLKSDVPGLDFIYMDVYWGDGWLSQEFERVFRRADLGITTEFPQMLEHAATWSHWSTDITYGPDTSRGINSHIIRFIRNHQKDMYLVHPLLGHAELGDFEGWQGRTDFNQFLGKLYRAALPSKFIQHFEILKWTDHEVLLTDGIQITDASGKRQIFQNGRLVLDGSSYLLPWAPREADKLYHWTDEDSESTWVLPPNWKTDSVKLYQLTDTGRVLIADLPVKNGEITIAAKATTPYVIYQEEAPTNPLPNWGEGSLVKDPGFYDQSFTNWEVKADDGVVSIVTDDHVRTALTIGESDKPAVVSQVLTGLKSGTYCASVWVEVDVAGRKASLVAIPENGQAMMNWTDSSPFINTVKNSHWNRTRTQLIRVLFDVPEGSSSAKLALVADPGTSRIRFDNIRVVPSVHTAKDGYDFWEDFENVDEGWYPFVKGTVGGVEDPRTHLAERHSPYTDAGWNGKLISDTLGGDWALKAHEERIGPKGTPGLIYRTLSQTLRFEPGNKYEVSFDYQCAYDGEYEFLVGVDADGESTMVTNIPFAKTGKTEHFVIEIEPTQKDYWIGAQRMKKNSRENKQADLVIDNLGVRKLDQ